MKKTIWKKVLLVACAMIVTLCVLTQNVSASENDEQSTQSLRVAATQPTTESAEDSSSEILGTLDSLPNKLVNAIVEGLKEAADILSSALMDGITAWLISSLLAAAETVSSNIMSSTANIFNFPWFMVIVGLFRYFGILLFAVGVVMAAVDVGVEYRRRGADLSGAMLNLGKGLMAVGLFSTVPVPLYKFCVNIQSVILQTLSIDWSFQSISDALLAKFNFGPIMGIMLIIIIVLIFLIYLDCLKKGGILLVQICIGSLYMISVPRGYMDNFYGWCKQVIALCLTALFQNLLMFCGLMIIPTNLFLGIGTMFAAKEVPKICAQFGLDTSVKASFTGMAIGANASVQAIKAAMTIAAA